MEPRYRLRLYLLTALILIGFGALLSRLYQYQIKERSRFLKQVPSNYTITIREPGIRGDITDRNGIILVQNLRNYEVVFNLDEIRDDYKRHLIESKGKDAVKDFKKIRTHKIINEWVRPKLALHKLDKKYNANALNIHYITHGGLVPFTFRDDLTYDQFAHFAEHSLELPGVDVRVQPRRNYLYGSLASHVLGYEEQWKKGEITPEEKRKYKHYTGDSKGKTGVEATMNTHLTGAEGVKTLLKNEKGEVLQMVDYIKPDVGARVELTIDARVQCLVENTLRRVGRAAAVVMDPNTGEVIAMASVPDFTPAASYSSKVWADYNSNLARPLINRAISNFTPGSTAKLPTAIAAAMHGHAYDTENCPGYVAYGNIHIKCWKRGGHGALGLQESIQRSCNCYFMKIANEIGSSKMLNSFELLGLGKKTGIELPSESAGFIPGNRYWRQQMRPGKSVTASITGMMAIGQSDSAATPLQMAAIVSAIANRGLYYKPRIVKRVIHPRQGTLVQNRPNLKVNLLQEGLKPEHLERIRKGMWLAANKQGGTALRAFASLKDRNVSAKTGTAQTVDMGIKSQDAWVVSFAPYENPKYVVVVAVKRGAHGGTVAGPLVQLIFRGLFARDAGLELPLQKMKEFEGDFIVREKVELPDEGGIIDLAYEDESETAYEANDILLATPVPDTPTQHIPQPTIKQEADAEGSTAPKAIIIEE